MCHATDNQNYRRVARWVFGAGLLALLVAAAALMIRPTPTPSFAKDSRFVLTTLPQFGVPPNAPLKTRIFVWLMRVHQRFGKPRPAAHSFAPSAPSRCSIHGLLNQCMEVSGVRYVIAKDVAAGSVQFGHTNTLNGAQWVKAFTDALQTRQPEWWDSQARTFRKEDLVLLTNGATTVLVLPKEMAPEFQRRK